MRKKAVLISLFSALMTFGAYAQKLSPNAEALLLRQNGCTATMLKSFDDTVKIETETVKVFINLNDEKALDQVRALGGKVFMTFDGMATAEVPVASLRAVSELDDVSYVEMGAPVHLCMDVARDKSGIDMIHTNSKKELPIPYTGKDVVIGIIDTGLEYNHLAFRSADGKTSRVKRIWNQNGRGNAPAKFGYGAEYVTENEIRAAQTDSPTQYHGSHTTGIAAGGDKNTAYYGVAPDADIVFVSFGQSTVDIPNAVQYIFDYAESVGKPCVINMSLGSHVGPHDGTSTLDRFFASVAAPGRIIVGSAGNEGMSKMHVAKTFTSSDTQLKTLLGIPMASNKNTAVDIWGTLGTEFSVELVVTDNKGKILERSGAVSSTSTNAVSKVLSNNVDCYFHVAPSDDPYHGAPNMYIECYINSVGTTRNIGLIVTGQDGGTVNMWNLAGFEFVSGGFRGWTGGDTACTVGEIGGVSDDVISVGSYNSRFAFPIYTDPSDQYYTIEGYGPDELPEGEISFFSSQGPTVDGRMKPDVLAPGALVISAMNRYNMDSNSAGSMIDRTYDSDGIDYYYNLNIGTSMSAPVVAGTMALWLQAKSDLTVQEARDVIRATSVLDSATGAEPNNNAGYGKLDAYNGIKYVLRELSGIGNVTDDNGSDESRVWVEDGTRTLCVASSVVSDISVYSTFGSQVGSYRMSQGLEQIDCSSWPTGLYIVRFDATGESVKVLVK